MGNHRASKISVIPLKNVRLSVPWVAGSSPKIKDGDTVRDSGNNGSPKASSPLGAFFCLMPDYGSTGLDNITRFFKKASGYFTGKIHGLDRSKTRFGACQIEPVCRMIEGEKRPRLVLIVNDKIVFGGAMYFLKDMK